MYPSGFPFLIFICLILPGCHQSSQEIKLCSDQRQEGWYYVIFTEKGGRQKECNYFNERRFLVLNKSVADTPSKYKVFFAGVETTGKIKTLFEGEVITENRKEFRILRFYFTEDSLKAKMMQQTGDFYSEENGKSNEELNTILESLNL